VGHDQNKLE